MGGIVVCGTRVDRLGDHLRVAEIATGALRRLEPELLGPRLRWRAQPRRVRLVAAGARDLVAIEPVVAGPHLDDQTPLVEGPRAEQRQEHPVAGVGVEVRRLAETRLREL